MYPESLTTTTINLDRRISLGTHSFEYFVRSGAWSELLERLECLQADSFAIITDDGFPPDLADEAYRHISSVGRTILLTIPAGETAKSLQTIEDLSVRAEQNAGISTSSCIIGLGGGLVANIAGLLAAVQFRGIRLVQVATTLLSMADVMPSLKQGVNSRAGKNHLGAYYTPTFVWNDLSYLRTLPEQEIRAALCEMIKFILSIPPIEPALYQQAIAALRQDGAYSQEDYALFIRLCLEAKMTLLRDDPFEKDEGLIFEYGHTVGHAIELASYQHGQQPLTHGLAIGVGLVVAARISRMLDLLSPQEEAQHIRLLRRNGAPTVVPDHLRTEDIMRYVQHDNKRGRLLPLPTGVVNMVLLSHIGEPHRTRGTVLTQVEESMVATAIDECR